MSKVEKLKKIYYDVTSSGSYGGIDRLHKAVREKRINLTRKEIESFLQAQSSYSLHKPARKHFKRNPIVVGGIDQQWQADLADMKSIAKENNGVQYLLTVIDCFSKFAWAIPVKSKGADEMLKAFQILLQQSKPRIPRKLQTDAGKEFLNSSIQNLLKKKQIHHFVTTSDKKAAIVERFNRTLKTRIWAYFTAHQTRNYIDHLEDFVASYNNSFHRSIGMKPSEVKPKDEDKIWVKLYGKSLSNSKSKIKTGQKVRISKYKGIMEKGYVPNWSEEHFHVAKELKKGKPVFTIKDDLDEDIKGQFYSEELQPIEKNRYIIEKIIKKRKLSNGSAKHFVKWKGWPDKFNSWLSSEELASYTQNATV